MAEEHITGLHLGRLMAVTNEDRLIPITCLVDHLGQDAEDLNEAVAFVAGSKEAGLWWSGLLSDFDWSSRPS